MLDMVPVSLSPKPGFCIKSITLSPAIFDPPRSGWQQNSNLLEPVPSKVVVPENRKVFVNIAWDTNVPPPPEGSEEAIQKVMQGEEIDESNPDGWFVPVIVSNAKADKDKAGNPCLVFDCVFNSSVRTRTLRDPEFKAFLIELALQRIEVQNRISLSRTIGTPNIASKGKLLPRTVQIPASMSQPSDSKPKNNTLDSKNIGSTISIPSSNSSYSDDGEQQQLLVKEISSTRTKAGAASNVQPTENFGNVTSSTSESTSLPALRGVLKSSRSTTGTLPPTKQSHDQDDPPFWRWSKVDNNCRIKVEVEVPGLTIPLVSASSLDISPRTLDLIIPNRKPLHLDLSLSDAEIAAHVAASYSAADNKSKSHEDLQKRKERKQDEISRVLQLKRQRDFDVERAEAEWKVDDATISIYV